jgi:hypothetical protein
MERDSFGEGFAFGKRHWQTLNELLGQFRQLAVGFDLSAAGGPVGCGGL